MTHDFPSVVRTADHRVVPELRRHRDETKGRKELVRHEEETGRVVSLRTDGQTTRVCIVSLLIL